PTDFAAGGTPVGIAAGHFDGDASLDLMTSTFGFVSVLLGNGNGTFQAALLYPTGLAPGLVTTADVDGDGNLDAILASSTSGQTAVAVLRGNGDGSFQAAESYMAGSSTAGLAVADLNGDGLPDVTTSDRVESSITILLDQPDGSLFAAPVSTTGSGGFFSQFVQTDFDGDGRTDLAWIESFRGS